MDGFDSLIPPWQLALDAGGYAEIAPALTCTWTEHVPSKPDRIAESDIRFRPRPLGDDYPEIEWFTTKDLPSGCSNDFDLEGVATHERGHSIGLDDIYSHGDGHPGLTMGQSNYNCSKQMRSLGKGDVLGLRTSIRDDGGYPWGGYQGGTVCGLKGSLETSRCRF